MVLIFGEEVALPIAGFLSNIAAKRLTVLVLLSSCCRRRQGKGNMY